MFATMNSVPSKPSAIMLLTAFPPPPPTPMTVRFGLISQISGFLGVVMTSVPESAPPPNRRGVRGSDS